MLALQSALYAYQTYKLEGKRASGNDRPYGNGLEVFAVLSFTVGDDMGAQSNGHIYETSHSSP